MKNILNISCLLMLTFSSLVFGEILTSNLDEASFSGINGDQSNWFAISFTTDNRVHTLQNVTVRMANGFSSGSFAVELYADGGGNPGTFLETLTGPGDPDGDTTYTSSGFPLAANTIYFIVLRIDTEVHQERWLQTNSNAQIGPGQIGDTTLLSDDGGATWSPFSAEEGFIRVDTVANTSIVEDFDYTTSNDLNGESGGLGFSGSWRRTQGALSDISGNSGFFPPVASVGGSARLQAESGCRNIRDINPDFLTSLKDPNNNIGQDGTTVYIRFIMQKVGNDTNDFYAFELFRDGDTDGERQVQIGKDSTATDIFGMRLQNNNGLSGSMGLEDESEDLYVLRIDFGASDNDTATLYRFENAGVVPPSEPVVGTVLLSATNISFDRIGISRFGGNPTGERFFDAIRIAETYNEAIDGPIANESFEYSDSSDLNGLNGGVGFNGGWRRTEGSASASTALSPGFSFAPIQDIGNKAKLDNVNSRTIRDLNLTGNFSAFVDSNGNIGLDGTTLYIRFIMQTTVVDTGDFYAFETFRDGDTDSERQIQVGKDSSATNVFGMRLQNNDGLSGSMGSENNFKAIHVLKIEFGASDSDTATLYRFPTLSSVESSEPITPVVQVSATNLSFDRIGISRFGGTPTGDKMFDEIKIAPSYEQVISGPVTYNINILYDNNSSTASGSISVANIGPVTDPRQITNVNLQLSGPFSDQFIQSTSPDFAMSLDFDDGATLIATAASLIFDGFGIDTPGDDDRVIFSDNQDESIIQDDRFILYSTFAADKRQNETGSDLEAAENLSVTLDNFISQSPTFSVGEEATAIELLSFQVQKEGNSVLVHWETATEKDNAGFYIWRSEKDGKFSRINHRIIPSQGTPTTGARYSFYDSGVQSGKTYQYKLEDIEYSGKSTFHPPVSIHIR